MANAGYVSNGGSTPACVDLSWVDLIFGRARAPPSFDALAWPLATFGAEVWLVVAFRERARTSLPFEGLGSITTMPHSGAARSVPRKALDAETEDTNAAGHPTHCEHRQ